jgi:hypothetical protein
MNEFFNNLIKWLQYIAAWGTYGSKAIDSVQMGLVAVRDNWPSKPTLDSPKKKPEPGPDDTGSVVSEGNTRTDDKVLDRGLSV